MKKIDKYQVKRSLGGGTGGSVYLVQEQLPGDVQRELAVKVLPTLADSAATQQEKFLAEARALVQFGNHPNVVTIYNYGIDDGTPWIAMELLPGSLAERIGDEPARPEDVLGMLRDVARALASLHGAEPPMLHCDLKPANILIDAHGNHKISDFGLVRSAKLDTTQPITTTRYAAPEMLNPELGSIGPATDLYALGHIAYEMALGRELSHQQFPAVMDTTQATAPARWMAWHCSLDVHPPPLRSVVPEVPEPLDQIIGRLLTKPLDQRLGSAEQLLAQLEQLDSTRAPTSTTAPASAAPGGAAATPGQAPPWRRPPILIAACFALVVILGLALLAGQDQQPQIELAGGATVRGEQAQLAFAGRVIDRPADAVLVLEIDDARRRIELGPDGGFSASHRLARPGRQAGHLRLGRGEQLLAEAPIRFERVPPQHVTLELRTRPAAPGASVRVRTADGRVLEGTTDDAGRAAFEARYGHYDLQIEHEEYQRFTAEGETGHEPVRTLEAELTPHRLPVRISLTPASASLVMRLEPHGEPIAVSDEMQENPATYHLAPGRYSYVADAEEHQRRTGYVQVAPGITNELRVSLPAVVQAAEPEPEPTPRELEAEHLASLAGEELRAYLERNAPLAQLRFEMIDPEIERLRARGPVLNAQELRRLRSRLEPVAGRLDLDELRVDATAVAARLQEDLREAGLGDARVQVRERTGQPGQVLHLTYTRSDELEPERVRQRVDRYVFEPELVVIRAYEPW